jgi:hypothetical protein
MPTLTETLEFSVVGLPPAKNEAKSMLSAGHPHASRVRALLAAARDALVEQSDGTGFGSADLGLTVVLTTATPAPSDATNYLGGIGDVLRTSTTAARPVTTSARSPGSPSTTTTASSARCTGERRAATSAATRSPSGGSNGSSVTCPRNRRGGR